MFMPKMRMIILHTQALTCSKVLPNILNTKIQQQKYMFPKSLFLNMFKIFDFNHPISKTRDLCDLRVTETRTRQGRPGGGTDQDRTEQGLAQHHTLITVNNPPICHPCISDCHPSCKPTPDHFVMHFGL